MLCLRRRRLGSLVGMEKSMWTGLLKALVSLVLVGSLLAVAYGLFVLGADLFVEYEEWDGIGVVLGVVILAVSLPVTATSVVWLRLLKRHW
jgi:hypothetical protein